MNIYIYNDCTFFYILVMCYRNEIPFLLLLLWFFYFLAIELSYQGIYIERWCMVIFLNIQLVIVICSSNYEFLLKCYSNEAFWHLTCFIASNCCFCHCLQVISSLACARRGWVNVDVDKIACESCTASLGFSLLPSWTPDEG